MVRGKERLWVELKNLLFEVEDCFCGKVSLGAQNNFITFF